jgi:hypothetical protein
MTLALEDLKIQLPHAKPGTAVFPISIYLHHQLAMLKAIEDGDITPDRLRKIAEMDNALIATAKEIDDEYQNKLRAERDKRAVSPQAKGE